MYFHMLRFYFKNMLKILFFKKSKSTSFLNAALSTQDAYKYLLSNGEYIWSSAYKYCKI